MRESDKKIEWFIQWLIPLIVSLMGIAITLFGGRHLLNIFITISAFSIIIVLIFFTIDFLQDRERRWKKNFEKHNEIEKNLNELSLEFSIMKSKYELNEKINKLEKEVSYIRGKNAK